MLAARHRAFDHLRHVRMRERKHDALVHELPSQAEASTVELAASDVAGDELLRLIFVACHPALSQESSVALTLRLLCGLTTDENARALLVPEPTIAQRITRTKRTLGERDVPFELPSRATPRLLATMRSGPPCARQRCVWCAFWPSSCRASRRCSA